MKKIYKLGLVRIHTATALLGAMWGKYQYIISGIICKTKRRENKMKKHINNRCSRFHRSNFAEYFVNKYNDEYNIIVLDKLTYAGNIDNLK